MEPGHEVRGGLTDLVICVRLVTSCVACSSPAVQLSRPEGQSEVKRSSRRGRSNWTDWFNWSIRSEIAGSAPDEF